MAPRDITKGGDFAEHAVSAALPVIQSTVWRTGRRCDVPGPTSHSACFVSLGAVRRNILCRVSSVRRRLKLITGLEFERLSPRAAVQMRVKKFK